MVNFSKILISLRINQLIETLVSTSKEIDNI
jgi:hypothetical protein